MASFQDKLKIAKSLPIFVAIITTLILCNACARFSQSESEVQSKVIAQPASIKDVVAFGRLIPKGQIISLSVANAEDSRVNKILVKEGDWVEAGQIVAILQGIERRRGDLLEAEQNVALQAARLKKIKSGDAKESEIAAQEAIIDRLKAQLRYETNAKKAALNSVKAELDQAKLTFQRKDSLSKQGAISQEESDLAKEQLQVASAILNQREAELNSAIRTLEKQIVEETRNLAKLKEVRPVDIEIAEAELAMAKIAVQQRKADLEDTQVRVPVAGRILRINTRVGERVDTEEGIIELGQTDEMYAIAEIYETEITKINLGQKASIESEYGGFSGKITGEVAHIGLQVGKQSLIGNSADPTTDENARVVEVKIRINEEDTPTVANLTNMQVQVIIDTGEQSAIIEDSADGESEKKDITPDPDRELDRNHNSLSLLLWGLGGFSLVSLARIYALKDICEAVSFRASRLKLKQNSLPPNNSNNLLLEDSQNSDKPNGMASLRPTIYLPSALSQIEHKPAILKKLKNKLYYKVREKQIAIATAEVELKQTKVEYLSATSELKEEIFDSDRLNYLKQKLLLVQNTLTQQKSKLDRDISDLQQQIALMENNF
ncbi:MAG: HlyD family efflux transporter periplasmic adaptor subunit [Cyanobacteria bacterium P01_E01_bin.35]